MTHLNIRNRILLAALLPAILLAVSLASLFLHDRLTVLNDAYRQKAEAMARQIAAGSEYGLFSRNQGALQALVDRVAREDDVRSITLLDAAGATVAQAGRPGLDARTAAPTASETGVELRENAMLLRRTIMGEALPLDDLVWESAPNQPRRLGELILELSTERIAEQALQLELTWILVTAGFLAFGALLAAYLSGGVIGPIVQVADVVARIGRGDLSARVATDAKGPLWELEEGVNGMAARIESGRDALQQEILKATASLRHHQEHLAELVRQRTAQLVAMSVELTKIEERERQTVAQDLHDGLGQTLAVARLKLSTMDMSPENLANTKQELKFIEGLIDQANQSVRSLSLQLGPSIPDSFELAPALEWLVGNMRGSFGLQVRLNIAELPRKVDAAALPIIFRATRELLVNVAKHSKVRSAELATFCEDGQWFISVADAGAGFDPLRSSSPSVRGGFGLFSLRERIACIGGQLHIDSSPGNGTVALLSMPLELDRHQDAAEEQ